MRKILIAVSVTVLAVIIAGTAEFWIGERAHAAFAQAVMQIRASLGPGGAFTYASASLHPFFRSAELRRVVLRRGSERITAERVTVATARRTISSLHAVGLRLIEAEWPGTVVTMSGLDATGIRLSSRGTTLDPADLQVGRLLIDGLAVRSTAGSANIQMIELDHYGSGRRSSIIMRGFSASLDAAGAKTRIDFPDAAASGLDLATESTLMRRGTRSFPTEPGDSRVTIDRLSIAGPSLTLAIGRIVMARSAAADRIEGGLVLHDLRLTSVRHSAPIWIGPDGLTGSLAEHVSVDVPGRRLDISPLRLMLAGLGTLDLGADFGHFDLAAFSSRPSAADLVRITGALQLISLHLGLRDDGLLDRLAALASQKSGLTPDQTRVAAAARIEGDPSLDAVPGAGRIRSALASFVAHGGTIELDLRPPSAISALAAAEIAHNDPAGAIDQLGLTLTNGAPDHHP